MTFDPLPPPHFLKQCCGVFFWKFIQIGEYIKYIFGKYIILSSYFQNRNTILVKTLGTLHMLKLWGPYMLSPSLARALFISFSPAFALSRPRNEERCDNLEM